MPRTLRLSAAPRISTTVNPGRSSNDFPQARENFSRTGGVANRLVVGVEHRDQTRIAGTLHIVLPAQGVESRSRTTDVPGQQTQRDQTSRVVGTRGVLGDTHAPKDQHAPGLSDHSGDALDLFYGNAADRGHLVRCIMLQHDRAEIIEPFGAGGDECLIDQIFAYQHVHHCVVKRDVRAGAKTNEMVSELDQWMLADIDDNQLGAAFGRLFDKRRRDRMIGRCVGARDERHFALRHVGEDIGHRPRSNRLHERRDRRGVTETGAMIDVIGSPPGANQLLEQIGFFIRTLGRSKTGNCRATEFSADSLQTSGNQIQGFLPTGFSKSGQHLIVVDDTSRFTVGRLGR